MASPYSTNVLYIEKYVHTPEGWGKVVCRRHFWKNLKKEGQKGDMEKIKEEKKVKMESSRSNLFKRQEIKGKKGAR
jgi:coenzyme F420-reducing hydrogenase beta subunit